MQDGNRGIEDARERRVPPAAAGDASRREPVISASPARRETGDRIPPTELLRQLVEATPKSQTGLRTLFDALYRQMQELDSERRSAQSERDQLRDQLQAAIDRPAGSGRSWVAWALLVAVIAGSGYVFAVPDLADQMRAKLRQQVASALDLATSEETRLALPHGERQPAEAKPAPARDVGAAIPQAVPTAPAAAAPGAPSPTAQPAAAASPPARQAPPAPAAASAVPAPSSAAPTSADATPTAAAPPPQPAQSEAARAAIESANGRVAALETQIEILTKRLAESERASQSAELKDQLERLAALERRFQEQQQSQQPARQPASEKGSSPAPAKQAKPLPGPPALPQARQPTGPAGSRATTVAPATPAATPETPPPPPVTASTSGSLGTLPVRAADPASQPAPPTSLLPQAQSDQPEVLGWIRAKEGDTIRSIAREQGIDLLKLARANGVDLLDTNRPLKAGERVTLPRSP
ncbi:MAG: LysM peptidoglycan-binding domain-containing protein [Alphaproteobacteria bacterium]|nr:LysM peptidoglycan-binding domain-containing protein [Alphaproteobacteria bacterium]